MRPEGVDGSAFRDVDALLAEAARRWGERPYLQSLASGAPLTFAEVDAACHRIAHLLADRGIRATDRVSVLSENCLELVLLFFGVQRYGASVNPINVEVNVKNVRQILDDVQPRLVLWSRTIPDELQMLVRDASHAVPFTPRGAAAGPPAAPDDLFARLADYPAAPCDRRVGTPRGIAIIDHTSGTTATPKGVCISHEAYFYMADSLVQRLGITEADRLLEYRALSWASPQVLSLGPTLQAGARLVLAPRFSRTRFFDWIREHGITIAAGVPAVFEMLLDRPATITRADLPTLRFITSSAAPLPAERQREFERRYGLPIVQGCGMTEAGFMGMNPPDARRPGSIGRPVPNITLWFADEQGGPCPPGQVGELTVSGPQLGTGYLASGGMVEAFPADGFRTGDVGYLDADGYVYLTDRKKDLIIRGGVNIAPMEVTSALLGHPGVAEAATIGVPDPVYGEAVASFVVPRPGQTVTRDELLAHCKGRLSAFKLPQHLLVVDAIPRSDRGKLAREPLRALWQALTRT